MTDRVISCPDCGGVGRVPMGYPTETGTTVSCGLCYGRKTIPNRRRATPTEDALRAEVAKYHGMELENAALRNDNESLTAELERWKAPLTDEQARKVMPLIAEAERHEIAVCGGYAKVADFAIRAVREAGEKP